MTERNLWLAIGASVYLLSVIGALRATGVL